MSVTVGDAHLTATIENGVSVWLSDQPLYCWSKHGESACYIAFRACMAEASELNATDPCHSVGATACFLATGILNGKTTPWCFLDMGRCNLANAHLHDGEHSGITDCFVVRYSR